MQGVSNMLERHLRDILDVASVRPVMNQVCLFVWKDFQVGMSA